LLVIDTSIAVRALLAGRDGFAPLDGEDLVAPPLLWSEARSVLHEMRWRGALDGRQADDAHAGLASIPVRSRAPARLGKEAWTLADQLGWAKTYDAEFVALAGLLRCRLLTGDARLRRGADRLGFVVGPAELA
jgi:predicted nucleic acid-binding protein